MCVALPHRISPGGFIEFTSEKTIDDTRSNSLRAQHHGHGSRIVFAVTRTYVEKEIRQRVRPARFHLKRVGVICPQMIFNGLRLIIAIGSAGVLDHLSRQISDARIEMVWDSEVALRFNKIDERISAQIDRVRLTDVGIDFISHPLLVVRTRLYGAFGIDAHVGQASLDCQHTWSAEQYRSIDGLNKEGLLRETRRIVRGSKLKKPGRALSGLRGSRRRRCFPAFSRKLIERDSAPVQP